MKNETRKRMKELLEKQSCGEREEKSKLIMKRLLSVPEYKRAGTLLSYVSLDSEVSTREVISSAIAEKKMVLVPAVRGECLSLHEIKTLEELKPGFMGIHEPKDCSKPVPLGAVELAIVPGLAFDEDGNRLGRGRGMFDRLFKGAGCFRIALAFDFQVLESIPSEPHDVPVELIITERRVIRTSGRPGMVAHCER